MAIKRMGVVGSGIMGSGVAEVAAKAGVEVVLRSRAQDSADAMVAGLEKSLAKQVDKGRLEEAERDAIVGRVRAVTDLDELADCDLVLESIVEELAPKLELFTELDKICGESAILASNTSTLSIGALAASTGRPDKVCGIHFFNPATAMTLVEVARTETTADGTIAAAREFAQSCGKTVVDVADRTGFVVNALLFPYLNRAVKLLEAGVASRDDIDTAMKGGCNFPMGPLELLDLVGLDTSLSIIQAIQADSGDPNDAPAPTLVELVGAGKLGRKSGAGFYDYAKK